MLGLWTALGQTINAFDILLIDFISLSSAAISLYVLFKSLPSGYHTHSLDYLYLFTKQVVLHSWPCSLARVPWLHCFFFGGAHKYAAPTQHSLKSCRKAVRVCHSDYRLSSGQEEQ